MKMLIIPSPPPSPHLLNFKNIQNSWKITILLYSPPFYSPLLSSPSKHPNIALVPNWANFSPPTVISTLIVIDPERAEIE